MQATNRIYEKPSRLSQGLVIGLSIAVVLMAGWFAVTVMFPQAATTADEGASDSAASALAASPTDRKLVSSAPDVPRQTARSNSVQFEWPEEFNSVAAPPPRTALPLAPAERSATRDLGRLPWPVPEANDRGFPARQPPPPTATGATDVIVDLLSPPPQMSGAREAAATASTPRPLPPRRQKTRAEGEAAPTPGQ